MTAASRAVRTKQQDETSERVRTLKPQAGPQEQFFTSPADIVIYGGAAGGGKSWALLVEPLRHVKNSAFGCVIFRREGVQIFNEGGLWDEAVELYGKFKARSNRNEKIFIFPGGAKIGFDHLQLATDVQGYQGAQIVLIGFDELTHFLAQQFWYMLSRNRSARSGIRPYVRATCNPDADSWVADLIAWWIDQDEFLPDGVTSNPGYGYPIPDRAGVVRHFIRVNGVIIWGDDPVQVAERGGFDPETGEPFAVEHVKSLTFIPAKLDDNQVLVKADPGYRANLMSLDPVERARLLGGNWKAKATAGTLFQRGWVTFVDAVPVSARRIRYWDRAASKPTKDNPDPDWTVGVLMAITPAGQIYIEDVRRMRGTPGEVESEILATAQLDFQRYGLDAQIGIEQDPGSAGKADGANYIRLLAGHTVRLFPVSKAKQVRFGPFSAQAQAGNVYIRRAEWNAEYIRVLEQFPSSNAHDDDVDATSGAYNALMSLPSQEDYGAASVITPADTNELYDLYDPYQTE